MNTFNLGDRVVRTGNPQQTGTVTECYSSTAGNGTPARPMYAVRWDGNGVERGYLSNGLQPAPLCVPTMATAR